MIQYLGLWAIAIVALNIWGMLSVFRSESGWTAKFVWFIVLIIPVLGFLAWYLAGPREARG